MKGLLKNNFYATLSNAKVFAAMAKLIRSLSGGRRYF